MTNHMLQFLSFFKSDDHKIMKSTIIGMNMCVLYTNALACGAMIAERHQNTLPLHREEKTVLLNDVTQPGTNGDTAY